jgi:tRNA (guanine-N7-)-methyltransferase
MLYELPSIVDSLELARLFAREQPLEVELGSGDGSFLTRYAARYPEKNFIGVERLLGRIRKMGRKGSALGLTNLRGVRIESGYFLQYLLPARSVEALHIYFPDPWPKRRHWHHRLINEHFPKLAYRALVPGGAVYLRTDNEVYYQQMRSVFGAPALLREIQTPPELLGLFTDFEKEFRARGIRTLYAAYQKKNQMSITGPPPRP